MGRSLPLSRREHRDPSAQQERPTGLCAPGRSMAPTPSDLVWATEEFACQLDIAAPEAGAYPGGRYRTVGYLHHADLDTVQAFRGCELAEGQHTAAAAMTERKFAPTTNQAARSRR